MQVVAVHTTMEVPVENGRAVIRLETGRPYVMHDVEAASGGDANVFERVVAIPTRPRPFDAEGPLSGRLIVPFIGGLGDAISMLPVLAAIRRRHAKLRVDVATTPGPAEVFALAPAVDRIVEYPLPVDRWGQYDHFLSMEAVHRTGQAPSRPLPEVFATALGLHLGDWRFELKLPRAVEAAAEPSVVPLVGIAMGETPSVRSYPQVFLRQLVGLLVERGLGCVLLGHADPSWNIPVCPPVITDMRSRTPSVLELAVWLRAVDVVVSHDSFVMHLAGALGRPTVALFAPTSPAHAAPYPNAVALTGGADCSPCHAAQTSCPLGLDHCVAWDNDGVRPGAVADAVFDRLARQGRDMPGHGIAVAL